MKFVTGFICLLVVFVCLPSAWKAQIIHDVTRTTYGQKVQMQKTASLRERQRQLELLHPGPVVCYDVSDISLNCVDNDGKQYVLTR
jgi:hypothetical protein